ncbi:IS630 family transposase [Lepagella muris]|uniref:IS630 family transposase n=1 Tax=Lepagella muris TaxID=3032870 RepID=UPI0023B84A58|nr:IS630 family transposase [Lepagella muris]
MCQGGFRKGNRHFGIPIHAETFFRTLGAGYKRIRLTPKGEPSPQILESAVERLQELDRLEISGHIDLVFGDESHVCTSGYVPYGWQFPDEKVSIRVEKCGRLNIFGMISRNNKYHGFTSTESINSDRFIEYMDEYTLTLKKLTVLVLDNASIHKSKKVKERVEDWKKRGLYIFYLPPYSPHLNLAETLWRILKGKWIKPEHYISKDTLFNAVQNILGGIGSEYKVRYSHAA